MLEEAKSVCDYLIVGLQTDPSIDRAEKNKPIQSLIERQIQLSGIKYVDSVIVYSTEEELLEILKTMDIDVRVIGSDYVGKDFTGKAYCIENGINIHYNRRDHDYSSSNLISRIKNV